MRIITSLLALTVCAPVLFASAAHSDLISEDVYSDDRVCTPHSCTDLGSGIINESAPGHVWQLAANSIYGVSLNAMLVDNGDGTVSDLTTGLIWEKSTSAAAYTWAEAKNYCLELTLGGNRDWRLPTGDELKSIVDRSHPGIAIYDAFLPDAVASGYWTSTVFTNDRSSAWYVYFGNGGGVGKDSKTDIHYVRAVRGRVDGTFCPAKNVLGMDNPQLESLRDLRDLILARSALGRWAIALYYRNVPSLNAALENSPALKAFARRVLMAIARKLKRNESGAENAVPRYTADYEIGPRKWWSDTGNRYAATGGVPEAHWAHSAPAGEGRTFISIHANSRCRQDGLLRKVRCSISGASQGKPCKIKVFRPNGSRWDLVGESGAIMGSSEIQELTLEAPIPWRVGDALGYYGQGSSLYMTRGAGTYASAPGDWSGAGDASVYRDAAVEIEAYSYSPAVVMTGDSLVGNGYHSLFYDDGPSGEAALQPLFALQQQLDPAGLSFQNLGKGSTQTSWALSTGVPAAIATGTANIVLKSGINDLAAGATWSQVRSNLDGIKSLCSASAHSPKLFIVSLSPDGNLTDDQAETARIWNGKMRAWCELNGATFIDTYNTMGQLRASTGCYDNLLSAYDRGDGVHYSAAGAAKLGSLIAEAIGRKYSGPEIGPIPRSPGAVATVAQGDDAATKLASADPDMAYPLSNSAL